MRVASTDEELRAAITSDSGYKMLENVRYRGIPSKVVLDIKESLLRYSMFNLYNVYIYSLVFV